MKGRPPHVGGKRTGNHDSIASVEKTPAMPKGKGGLPHKYFGNSDDCKSTDRSKE